VRLSEATRRKLERPFPFEGWAIRFGELVLVVDHMATIEGDESDASGWRKTGALKKGELIVPIQMVPLPKGRVAVQCLTKKGLVSVWSKGAHVQRP
jgi:hypothetical protein